MYIRIYNENGKHIDILYLFELNTTANISAQCFTVLPVPGMEIAQPVCPDLKWSVDNPNIVGISNTTGTSTALTSIGSGTAHVTVVASDGTTTSLLVQVTQLNTPTKAAIGLVIAGGLLYVGYMAYELILKKR